MLDDTQRINTAIENTKKIKDKTPITVFSDLIQEDYNESPLIKALIELGYFRKHGEMIQSTYFSTSLQTCLEDERRETQSGILFTYVSETRCENQNHFGVIM